MLWDMQVAWATQLVGILRYSRDSLGSVERLGTASSTWTEMGGWGYTGFYERSMWSSLGYMETCWLAWAIWKREAG